MARMRKPRRATEFDDVALVREDEERRWAEATSAAAEAEAASDDDEDEDEEDVAADGDGDGDGDGDAAPGPEWDGTSRILRPDTVAFDPARKPPKLTKKQAADLARWKGESRTRTLSAFIKAKVEQGRTKFGHSAVYVGSDARRLVVGIPTPALAFEFLIGNNIFPLGLLIQLVAETGTGKSALVCEFGRWFMLASGILSLHENETKYDPLWFESILPDEFGDFFEVLRCESVEDWQRKLTFSTNYYKQKMVGTKEEPGPGRSLPVLLAVDSVMGKQSEESAEKILGKKTKGGLRGTTGEGAAGRAYPVEAGAITKYIRAYASELDGWPMSLLLVNHLKPSRDESGNEVRTKAGGRAIDFQESFEIELTRTKRNIGCADWSGWQVLLTCYKNSFGPGFRKVATRVIRWRDPVLGRDGLPERGPDGRPTGATRLRTVWDWDWSTVWLLNQALNGERVDSQLRKSLKEAEIHVDCPSVSDVENSAWSRTLGMRSAKEAVSWTELGAMFRADPVLMNRVRNALFIQKRSFLAGDYLRQLDAEWDAHSGRRKRKPAS